MDQNNLENNTVDAKSTTVGDVVAAREKEVGKFWEGKELYKADDESAKPKKYVLVEFPYPSGSGLHIGHTFSFTGADVYARYWRMKGYNVLFPMGWDAFGLPTENFAIKTKRKPQEVTKENTDMFRSQMKKLALSFDWSREVNTTDPEYYKWTQWIFVQLYKKGLAYKKSMPINWCPSCKIGLANEEVVNGKCERCGSEVSRRTIAQWVVKITDYADRLIEGLEKTDFIEKVKQAQINWIGKSSGARVKFKIKYGTDIKELEVFTTRPDTINGATFMVVAPEHPLVQTILSRGGDRVPEVQRYLEATGKKSEMERTELSKEKTGVFTGLYAINPVSGREMEIWISDFVLAAYGTGAIMAVPAHDQRDWEFARKFGLDIIPVVYPKNIKEYVGIDDETLVYDEFYREVTSEKPYVEAIGKLGASGDWDGWEVPRDFSKVLDWIEEKGIGHRASSYHLRDWIFSRQHYWGEPIPMVFCQKCADDANAKLDDFNKNGGFDQFENPERMNKVREGMEEFYNLNKAGWWPVPEDQLPVVLPEVEAYEPTDNGESPLSKITDWVKTTCPVCGGEARRETDTMPNWAGSDWYFMRYCDPDNDAEIASIDKLKKWMPVDVYIGGDEHNTLHLLYSRFIYNFLFDLGVVPQKEPYDRRVSHGVILGPDNQRMSKSRGNVIIPETVIEKYGVDVCRTYLMFMGPFDGTMAWNDKTLMGVKRFLEKFERLFESYGKGEGSDEDKLKVKRIINRTIAGVEKDIEQFGYNTAIAKLMQAVNELNEVKGAMIGDDIKALIALISPFAPYLAEYCWQKLDGGKSVHTTLWPTVDEKYLVDDEIALAVAINGKTREVIKIDSQAINDQAAVLIIAKENETIKKWLEGKEIVREIYVPGKMVNLVIK